MKTANNLFLPVLLFFLLSCENEGITKDKEKDIADISVELDISFSEISPLEVTVTVQRPACYEVDITHTSSGKIFDYDLILTDTLKADEHCIAIVEEETVEASFDPVSAGEHTLNFYVNGEFYETHQVIVEE